MTPNATGTINCKAWNSPAEYPSWVARCDIKRSDGTMLNTIFWEKVQGQKILGVERLQNTKYLVSKCYLKQIPKVTSILVLNYLSESKTQLVHQRKLKVAFNPGTTNSPEIQSYRMWWGAASPILNDTPVVCIYTSYNRTHVKNHIYTYIYIHRASGPEQRSSGGNTSSNPQVSAPVSRPVVNGMERMCQRHGSHQTPTLLFESKTHMSINSYSITYAVEEFLLSIIPNSVIVLSLH